jgi:hypothetical protein
MPPVSSAVGLARRAFVLREVLSRIMYLLTRKAGGVQEAEAVSRTARRRSRVGVA